MVNDFDAGSHSDKPRLISRRAGWSYMILKPPPRRLFVRRSGSMTDILDGVCRPDWVGRPRVARRVGSALARDGKVAYWRAPASSPARPKDYRVASRVRTRLRSAKLLTLDKKFLCECSIRDRSPLGLGLALGRSVKMPSRLCLFDDETGQLRFVVVAWRRGAIIGVRYCASGAKPSLRPSELFALSGRYYGIPDAK